MSEAVVPFPEGPEERARRLLVAVERLAGLPSVEWLMYLPDEAKKHCVEPTKLKTMIEKTIKERKEQARVNAGETRRTEQRKEKEARRKDTERKQKERKEREEEKAAERKERDKEKRFAATIKLPSGQHEGKLKALAKRIGEDIETLRGEFEEFAQEGKSDGDDIVPWPDPVSANALLADVMKQLRRYVVVSDEQALAIALWVALAWLHNDIAVHSPLLALKSAEADSGKTTACGVLRFLTPRAYSAVEMSGPSLFRFVDRMHPTLIIDDADRLLQRKPELAHIINVGWTRGRLAEPHRRGQVGGVTERAGADASGLS